LDSKVTATEVEEVDNRVSKASGQPVHGRGHLLIEVHRDAHLGVVSL
jgi:hypothetical protein